MTLMRDEKLDEQARRAQWQACHELMGAATCSGNMDVWRIARAMFHAGEAWAYYQASDVVIAALEKAKAAKSKKPSE